MIARIARLSVALLVAAPLAAPSFAQGVQYAAGTTKYRITSTTSSSQTSPMGSATVELGLQEVLTVNLLKTSQDTMTATVTLDSITLKSSGPTPDVSKLHGGKFVATLNNTGKFFTGKSPDGVDPQLASLLDGILHFLPQFRGDLAAGKSWSDTTSGKVPQQGLEMDRTAISNYKVSGDTTIGSDKAFKVQRITSVKAAGSGSMQGTPVAMESVVTSTGMFFLTPAGVYLGGNSNDDVSVKISILAQNAEVNIKQSAKTQIQAIR
ncbi:MAG: hypothetical protein ABJE47_03580 [bacterium]